MYINTVYICARSEDSQILCLEIRRKPGTTELRWRLYFRENHKSFVEQFPVNSYLVANLANSCILDISK